MSTASHSGRFRRIQMLSVGLLLAALAAGCTFHAATKNYGSSAADERASKDKADGKKKPSEDKKKPSEDKNEKKPRNGDEKKPTLKEPPAPSGSGSSGSSGSSASPAPSDGVSRLVVPVRAPFEAVVDQLDALLPKTQSQDFKRVTKKGASPDVEVKYKAWRDPIEASFQGKTLRLVVPVRYAANIRAKVKNPLGGDWITVAENETWGTSSKPQRMKVAVELTLDINSGWKVTSVSKLDGITHGKAPGGSFCAKVGIDICTSKENLAPHVRDHLNEYLVPKIQDGLRRADSAIEKAIDPKTHATAIWAALQTPQQIQKPGDKSCPTLFGAACKEAAWVVIAPTSLGMTQLSLDEEDFGVDLSLEAKITTAFGKKPKVDVEPLPKLSEPVGPTGFQLRTSLELPLSTFSGDVQKALSGADFAVGSTKLALGAVDVSVDESKQMILTVTTSGAHEGKLVAKGKLGYSDKTKTLEFSGLEFDAASEVLFKKELKGLDLATLKKRLESAVSVDLSKQESALQKALTAAFDQALPGKLDFKGALSDVKVLELTVKDKKLILGVELQGSLGIEYAP